MRTSVSVRCKAVVYDIGRIECMQVQSNLPPRTIQFNIIKTAKYIDCVVATFVVLGLWWVIHVFKEVRTR